MRLPRTLAERPWRGLLLAAPVLLAACSNLPQPSSLTGALKPYRADVIQGNFVSREMADQLKPGMSREQVREIMGTPLLQDIFHAERWDYVFSLRRGYDAPIQRRFTVVFDADGKLLRTQGDPLPSENAFVAQINALRQGRSTPKVLTAQELQARIDAAAKAHPPVASGSAAVAGSTPDLTVVASPAEIDRLQALVAPDASPQP